MQWSKGILKEEAVILYIEIVMYYILLDKEWMQDGGRNAEFSNKENRSII